MEIKLTQWPEEPPASTRRLRLLAEAASEYFDVSLDRLKSGNRSNEVVWPRSICMWLAREAKYSSSLIGEWWGKHHSTVLYAERLVNDLREAKPSYEKQFRSFVLFYKNYTHRVEKK
jgi:chromosomal replication initiation ATPase DnaA